MDNYEEKNIISDFTDFRMPRATPFTTDQETWIIIQYGQLQNVTKVKRNVKIHFNLSPHKVPDRRQFSRIVERFLATGSVKQKKPSGRPLSVVTDENAAIVDELIENDPRISIRQISSKINLSVGSV